MDHSELLAKNAAIAAALGATIIKADPDYQAGYAVLNLDGLPFSMSYNGWGNKGKVHVSVKWPATASGHVETALDYNQAGPAINVSLDKSPDRIAADIKRRFVPDAAAAYDKALARVQSADAYAYKKAANLAAIAAACGGRVSDNGSGAHVYGLPAGMSVKYVNDDSARLELDLPIADVCALIAAAVAKGAA